MRRLFSLLVVLGILASFVFPFDVSAAEIDAKDPKVIVSLPETAVYGHRPIEFTITIKNQTHQPVSFDGNFYHGGSAWSGGDYPYTFSAGTEVYRLECNIPGTSYQGCRHWWKGTVPGGQVVTFTLPTFTSASLGTFPFLNGIFDVAGKTVTFEKSLTLTEGNKPPYGVLSIGTRIVHPGESYWLDLAMWAPKLTQFVGQPFTSTCGMLELPGGFTAHPYRTYEKFRWYVTVPTDARFGPCEIRGVVGFWRSSETFIVSLRFVVLPPRPNGGEN